MQRKKQNGFLLYLVILFNNCRTSDDNGTSGPDSSSEDSVPCLVSISECNLMLIVPVSSHGHVGKYIFVGLLRWY